MKIIVRSPGYKCINLHFPSGLGLNPASAMFLPRIMKKNGINITRKQALTIVRAINRYRRSNPSWKFIEVQSSNGDYIEIAF